MRLEVASGDSGERLDTLLSGPLGSRARAQRLIAAGQVSVDGQIAAKSSKPVAGAVIEVDESDRRDVAADDVDHLGAFGGTGFGLRL